MLKMLNNTAKPTGPVAVNPKPPAQRATPVKKPVSGAKILNSKQLLSNHEGKLDVSPKNPLEMENWLYKTKCSKIEKKIKEMVFVNAALEAEVRNSKNELDESNEERKFLLNRLLSYQKDSQGTEATSKILQQALCKKAAKGEKSQAATSNSNSNAAKRKKTTIEIVPTSLPSTVVPGNSSLATSTVKSDSTKGLSQLLVDCNSGASSSFLLDS
ncbi:hypothetical protein HDE_09966 [Halotydeus destructor]|nr:hypothetical protein HDE_09966 [Halotydeus destructor]